MEPVFGATAKGEQLNSEAMQSIVYLWHQRETGHPLASISGAMN